MKRVYVVSPLSAPTSKGIVDNIRRARALCYAAIVDGDVAPFAPHAFYTAFLDDGDPEERELGIHAGEAWLFSSDELWVWSRNGISGGMRAEIEVAKAAGIPIVMDPKCWKEADA